MTFHDLALTAPLQRAVEAIGYDTPTPIQQQAIPAVLAGRDLLGCAQTGTGKTAAFALPLIQLLDSSPAPRGRRPVRALILTPTRELAIQIDACCRDYARFTRIRHTVIFGGVSQRPQVEALQQGVDLLVATPGRLLDLLGQGCLTLDAVRHFVLDEADRMLDMGFIHDIKRLLPLLPRQKQTLLFSATMPADIAALAGQLLHDPVHVTVTPPASVVETIRQEVYFVEKPDKSALLAELLRRAPERSTLVFARTKHGADRIARTLTRSGIPARAIHGDKSQGARQKALGDFKSGELHVLIATDIAARGIDISELPLVVNYDLPEVPETYVHRIGRTGRAGRGGAAVSFCDVNEKEELKAIEKLLGRPVPVVDDHPWPMEVLEPAPRDKKGRVVNPEDAEARAAAKERRRQRDAANKAANQAKNAKAAQKAPEPQPPEPPAAEPAPKKRRGRGRRSSATLEEALTAVEPKKPERARPVYDDFQKPDPLASDVIMDATARLLSSRRPLPVREERPRNQRRKRQEKQEQRQAKPAPKPAPAPKADARRGGRDRGRSRRPMEPDLRKHGQKDSTEQPSLMKPYYLSDD